ncbi:MAG: class D sortase [bacterium]|nr:class D sortase [bacterium]
MPKNTDQHKIYKKLGFVLITLSLLGIGIPLLSFGFLDDYAFLDTLSEQEINSAITINDQFVVPGQEIAPTPASNTATPVPDYELKNINNRLSIPQIGINMPIFLSDSVRTLAKGGWMFPHTSTPDKGGNTVIFGHRFKFLPPIGNTFYNLDKLTVGEEFELSWQGATYRYRVIESKVVEPTDLSVLNPTDSPRLTLITCSPLFTSKQRLIIIAERI